MQNDIDLTPLADTLNEILDISVTDDGTVFVLSEHNELIAKPLNSGPSIISLPEGLNIEAIDFLSESSGYIYGTYRNIEDGHIEPPPDALADAIFYGGITLILLLLIGLSYWLIKRFKWIGGTISASIVFALFWLASSLISVGKSTILSDAPLQEVSLEVYVVKRHFFLSQAPQSKFIAFTEDGGQSWRTERLNTNFSITDVQRWQDKYLVTTHATFDHPDGDIIVVDPKTAGSPTDDEEPIYRLVRSLFGVRLLEDKLVAFGSDKLVGYVGPGVMQNYDGEIVVMDQGFGVTHLLNIPGGAFATDFEITPDGTFWAISDERLVRCEACLVTGTWETLPEFEGRKAKSIRFYEDLYGFLELADGSFFVSQDAGITWAAVNPGITADSKVFETVLGIYSVDGSDVLRKIIGPRNDE